MVNIANPTERQTERRTEGAVTEAAKSQASSPSPSRVKERATARIPERIVIRTAGNRFDIPEDEKPDGMDYLWVAKFVRGQLNRDRWMSAQQNGWRPVPAGRHPNYTMAPADSNEEIEVGGLVLCERAKEITEMAKNEERKLAKEQVQMQMTRLDGRARETQSRGATRISQNYEPVTDE